MPFNSGRLYGMPQLCRTATISDEYERQLDGAPPTPNIEELIHALHSERENNRELANQLEHQTTHSQTQQLQNQIDEQTGDMGRMVEQHNGATARHQDWAEQQQKRIDEQEALIEALKTKIRGKDLKNTLLTAQLEKSQEEASQAYLKAYDDLKKNVRIPPHTLWTHLKEMIRKTHMFSDSAIGSQQSNDTLIRSVLRLVLDIMLLSSDHSLWDHAKADIKGYARVQDSLDKIAGKREHCLTDCKAVLERMQPVVSGAGPHTSRKPASDYSQPISDPMDLVEMNAKPGLISAFDGFPWSSQY
jgi:hypothetical protein